MEKKRNASILIEALIAFVIITMALAISFVSPAKLLGIYEQLKVKSDIYDLAYSLAEKILTADNINEFKNKTEEINGITYSYNVLEKNDKSLNFGNGNTEQIDYVELSVYVPDKFEDNGTTKKYELTLEIVLKP